MGALRKIVGMSKLHTPWEENTLLDKQLNRLNQRLLEFQFNSNTMLRHNDRHFIEYPVAKVIKWPILKKK
jgi:hypothetical protein